MSRGPVPPSHNPATFTCVDRTIGSRVVLGFEVRPEAIAAWLPAPWRIDRQLATPWAGRPASPDGPNLMLVFNDLLFNQDGEGRRQPDAAARYLGINIPSSHPETGEAGMNHVRVFTSNPHWVPGRYRDSLPAAVRRVQHIEGSAPGHARRR